MEGVHSFTATHTTSGDHDAFIGVARRSIDLNKYLYQSDAWTSYSHDWKNTQGNTGLFDMSSNTIRCDVNRKDGWIKFYV